MNLLLKKLYIDRKEFVTSAEIGNYCRELKLRYDTTLRYMMSKGFLVRIFRGIFYVKTLDEVKLNRARYSNLELVAKGLGVKGVKNWYFGLHTALKLNNMTHEYFAVDCVINDRIFRARPMKIAGQRFRFVKLAPHLVSFGIVENGLRYSDPEKTILDFIYLWRYSGVPEEKIIADISEWTTDVSARQMKTYAAKYPKSVARIVEEMVG